MGKKEKYGSYLCKIGYFDIRQKIEMPRIRKLSNGESQTLGGKVEVFIYHGKHQLAGPFKGSNIAIIKANDMLANGIKYEKFNKS